MIKNIVHNQSGIGICSGTGINIIYPLFQKFFNPNLECFCDSVKGRTNDTWRARRASSAFTSFIASAAMDLYFDR